MANTDLVEIVNLSNHEGAHKVVQLYADEKPVLVLGPFLGSLHCKLLESFLRERGLGFDTMIALGSRISALVPALEGHGYRVVGMGRAELYPARKLYTGMDGISQDYKIGIDKEHRNLVKKTLESMGWECI